MQYYYALKDEISSKLFDFDCMTLYLFLTFNQYFYTNPTIKLNNFSNID